MKRVRIIVGLAALIFCLSVGTANASTSTASASGTCRVFPDEPYHYGDWGPIHAEANILCGHKPSVSSMTIRLWMYVGGGRYQIMKEYTSNHTGTNWWIKTGELECPLGDWFVTRSFHTQVVGSYFYGQWYDVNVNSGEARLQC